MFLTLSTSFECACVYVELETHTHTTQLDDETSEKSNQVLRELEFIDDETDQHGILMVKIDDLEVAKSYGIDPNEIPNLVYFEKRIPNFYVGDLLKEKDVLDWLIHQKASDEIEDVSDAVLHQLVATKKHIAVLFCTYDFLNQLI